jgi:hypothetical protein
MSFSFYASPFLTSSHICVINVCSTCILVFVIFYRVFLSVCMCYVVLFYCSTTATGCKPIRSE